VQLGFEIGKADSAEIAAAGAAGMPGVFGCELGEVLSRFDPAAQGFRRLPAWDLNQAQVELRNLGGR
jgi:hypothetical protein